MAGERILVVEDNEKNMKLLRDVLGFRGYEVLEAVTGEEGVALAREHLPALILMDIQLLNHCLGKLFNNFLPVFCLDYPAGY